MKESVVGRSTVRDSPMVCPGQHSELARAFFKWALFASLSQNISALLHCLLWVLTCALLETLKLSNVMKTGAMCGEPSESLNPWV